jgi:type II secretory pathway pseudopilin PulG
MVVVAIIAVLVAILVPSLQEAKDMAQTAACQTNLRHIGMAMANYLLDFKNYYPPCVFWPEGAHGWRSDPVEPPSTTTAPIYSWPTLLYPYTQGNRNFFEPTDDIKAGNIFRCPTWLGTRPNGNQIGMCSSYTYRTSGTYQGYHTHRPADNPDDRCFAPLYYSYVWNRVARWCNGWREEDHHGFISYHFGNIGPTYYKGMRAGEVKDQSAFLITDFRLGNIWVASSQSMWACGWNYNNSTAGPSGDHGIKEEGYTHVGWHHMDGYNALCPDGSTRWMKWGDSRDGDWSIQID